MLAEIDLPNTSGAIRDHMYGRVEITLEEGQAGVRLPSTCLVGDVANGQAKLFVVHGDHVKLRQVQAGRDTGIEVEVLSGLALEDMVVARPPAGLADGTRIAAVSPARATAKAK
jgi:multidrug efflux pump subunit AcrA (membrane-fusion protein)